MRLVISYATMDSHRVVHTPARLMVASTVAHVRQLIVAPPFPAWTLKLQQHALVTLDLGAMGASQRVTKAIALVVRDSLPHLYVGPMDCGPVTCLVLQTLARLDWRSNMPLHRAREPPVPFVTLHVKRATARVDSMSVESIALSEVDCAFQMCALPG